MKAARPDRGDPDCLAHHIAHAGAVDLCHGENGYARLLQDRNLGRARFAQADEHDVFRRKLRLERAGPADEAQCLREHRLFRDVGPGIVGNFERSPGIDPDQAQRMGRLDGRCQARQRDAPVGTGRKAHQACRQTINVGGFDQIVVHRLQPRAGALPGPEQRPPADRRRSAPSCGLRSPRRRGPESSRHIPTS